MDYNINFLDIILDLALKRNASDIILSAWSKISFKINWDIIFLDDYEILDNDKLKTLLVLIIPKNLQEKFVKNLELDFSIALKDNRFRVNIFINKIWYALVFRPIINKIPDFDTLWLNQNLKDLVFKKNGLILITWSVSSWKSTTMAALVNHINENKKKHIITIEDPIEYVYHNSNSLVDQREVWSSTLSFENWLKYALRQASDVIMVWEMRDLETFRLSLRAAETWNLVFSTLHTSWTARTISRIIDIFPWNEKDQIRTQLSISLIAVIWQKLVKTKDWKRIAAIEVLRNTTWISNIIRKWDIHQIDWVIETGSQFWMITMKKSLENLYENGIISKEVFDDEIENNNIL